MQKLLDLDPFWSLPITITSGLGLIALCVMIAYLVARVWLKGRQRNVSAAIRSQNKEALATLIGVKALDLAGLNQEQLYYYAREKLRLEFRAKITVYLILAAIVSMIIVLSLAPNLFRAEKPAELDTSEALQNLAFDTFSGKWTLDGECDFAMSFSVSGNSIKVKNPEPDEAEVAKFWIVGAYKNGIKADDNGVSVRLWTEDGRLIYEREGLSQSFVRCK